MNYWLLKFRHQRPAEWLRANHRDTWWSSRVPLEWSVGDRLFFWMGAPALSVVGLGSVEELSRTKWRNGTWKVPVKYLSDVFDHPVGIDQLRAIPSVKGASFLKAGPSGTIFPLSETQGKALLSLSLAANPEWRSTWRNSDGLPRIKVSVLPDASITALEGRVGLVPHVRRERNRRLAEAKKRLTLSQLGRLPCEACGFDFARAYGSHGEGFAEVHHKKPLSTSSRGTRRGLRDLAILCSNCHRMIHRVWPTLSVEDLRTIIRRKPNLALQRTRSRATSSG